MISLSCAEYAFPLLPPRARLSLLRLLEFDRVDIGLFERDSALAPSCMMKDPRGFAARLRADLERERLQVADIFLQIGRSPAEAEANTGDMRMRRVARDVFRHTVDLCHRLGTRHLTGLPGIWHENEPRDKDLHHAADEAVWRVDTAREAGIRYAIEPHIGSLCATVEETKAFLAMVPGLTLTLDYGHFIAAGATSESVHTLLPHASHLHARGGAPRRLQTAVEENKIDFAGMMENLRALRYDGSIAVEYVWTGWQACNRTDNVAETILLRRQLQTLVQADDSEISKRS